jgi:hypothetical protein
VLRGCVHSLDKKQEERVGDRRCRQQRRGRKGVSEFEEREMKFNDMLKEKK